MSDRVTVAYVHSTELATSFLESLLGLVMFDAGAGGHLAHDDGKISLNCATNGLVAARNAGVEAFLAGQGEWLLWLDTDMGFAPDTLYRLMAVADPVDRPIVGALCFASREVGADGMGGYRTLPRPTIYDYTARPDGTTGFVGRLSYPVNALVQCAATGSACVLIHRSVFERISASLVEHDRPATGWYEQIPGTDGRPMGEDISFCARAGAAGIPVHVHTGVRTSHLKPMWLGEAHFWAQVQVPPATEDTAVIVPVMGRPHHAAPFMASLRASTGLATVYAVCDPGDPAAAAWRRHGAVIVTTGGAGGTFAQKVNRGYRKTSQPWLLLVGSDVRFWPGWLDHAQAVAHAYAAHVIGVNDLGNPRTLAGEHAGHLLVSRRYIDQVGASWDGPGVLAHEGYRHWFVDDEIVTAAKQAGVWQMALGARVEHLHPLFGKADMDEVYELGQSHIDADRALFAERAATYADAGTDRANGRGEVPADGGGQLLHVG